MKKLSLTKYGKHQGVWKSAAARWRDAGHLVMEGAMVLVEPSDANLKAAGLGIFGKRQRSTEPVSAPAPAPDDESVASAAERIIATTGADMTKAEAERVKENYLALMRRLEYDKAVGLVVMADEVARRHGEACARIRTRLLAIPSAYAPRFARITDAAVLNAEMERVITEVLVDLTNNSAERAAARPDGSQDMAQSAS